ncbi:hypothetical protein [Actinoplanes regularis]|nr:hypothetical protein [Actinoplanes regularis]
MSVDEKFNFPDNVVAIALDTNSMPRGLLDLSKIEDLVNIIEEQERDIAVWILEPVLWEWAEHLRDSISRTVEPFENSLAAARRVGLDVPNWPGLPSGATEIEHLVKVLSDSLEGAGAEIVRLATHPLAAVQGIRDQILQTGAARRKTDSGGNQKILGGSRVKTGAADSASFNLLEQRASTQLRNVVLVSADRDAVVHFKGRESPIMAKDLWQTRRGLLTLTPGSELALNEFLGKIYDQLPEIDQAALRLVPTDDYGNLVRASGWDLDRYLNTKTFVTQIDSVDEVWRHRDVALLRISLGAVEGVYRHRGDLVGHRPTRK